MWFPYQQIALFVLNHLQSLSQCEVVLLISGCDLFVYKRTFFYYKDCIYFLRTKFLKHQMFRQHLAVFLHGWIAAGEGGYLVALVSVQGSVLLMNDDGSWSNCYSAIKKDHEMLLKCSVFHKTWFSAGTFNIYNMNPEPSNVHAQILLLVFHWGSKLFTCWF